MGMVKKSKNSKWKNRNLKKSKEAEKKKRRPMQLKHLFDEYDLEGTGHIRKEDLGTMLFELSVISPNLELPTTVEDLNFLMEILDEDHNGTIEKQEFVNWVEKGLSMSDKQRKTFRSGSVMRFVLGLLF